MACGFRTNSVLDELAERVSLLDGQVDEVEHLVKVDDDSSTDDDDLDAKFRRDTVRHVASRENAVRVDYLASRLSDLAFRLAELRRRNEWVRQDIEEHQAKVGDTVAEDGTPEQREEIRDGLRDAH